LLQEIIRLLVAVALGSLIGLERERRERGTILRTQECDPWSHHRREYLGGRGHRAAPGC
jgi:hypothetical protein